MDAIDEPIETDPRNDIDLTRMHPRRAQKIIDDIIDQWPAHGDPGLAAELATMDLPVL